MNEAVGFRSNGLTKQQKAAQQASVYGLDPEIWAPSGAGRKFSMSPNTNFTTQQLEQMRQILAQHDSAGKSGPNEFDLAKPPVSQYRHQEYPRCMYHHESGRTKNANSAEEREDAEAAGWSTSPTAPVEVPIDEFAGLSDEDRAEAIALDAKAKEPKKHGGRH